MNILLSTDQEQFVQGLVAGGQYTSEHEVVAAALHLLALNDELKLREDIALGIEQADRGDLTTFDPEATLRQIRERRAGGR